VVELVLIPAFFKKKVIATSLRGGLALVDAEDLVNNISTSNWLLPISNRFYLYSFYSFL
jgi:hypothetical protein